MVRNDIGTPDLFKNIEEASEIVNSNKFIDKEREIFYKVKRLEGGFAFQLFLFGAEDRLYYKKEGTR